MAGDDSNKTEQATPKRKDEARRQGQVAVSRDVGTAAILLGGVGFLAAALPLGVRQLTEVTRHGLALSFEPAMLRSLTAEQVYSIIVHMSTTTLMLVLPLLALILV